MPATPFDSSLYRDLFTEPEAAKLFTDSAEIRAMLLVEGALARAQGRFGIIPETAAKAIHRAAREVQIDPAALARETGRSAVPVPALVAAFRAAMAAPDHARHLHHGATSQDIQDTALALRLKRALQIAENHLSSLLVTLADLAEQHAETPMAARTWGQPATPSSFGAHIAAWGRPLLAWQADLAHLAPHVARVSLSGASGTAAALGDQAPRIRAAMAESLGLTDPGHSWHSERDGIARLAHWLGGLTASLGKIGIDTARLTTTGEARLAATGGSSTMPQKQNPVAANLLEALARHGSGLTATLTLAPLHAQARDGGAWLSEWLALPQLVLVTARALATARQIAESLSPNPATMTAQISDPMAAEALQFALAAHMPRPDAQAALKEIAATTTAQTFRQAVEARFPDHNLAPCFDPAQNLGQAPAEARAFAQAARSLP